MYQMVSLIPARGGSERIQRKNIRIMAGKPMLVWTIEASIKAKSIKRTIVSTEDPEIKDIAIRNGAEVLDRPVKYSTDNNYELMGIFQQLKEYLWEQKDIPDFMAFLYPTSPLRTAEMIDGAYEEMIKRNCNRVYTAYEIEEGLFKECWKEREDKRFEHAYYYTHEETHKRHLQQRFENKMYVHTNDVIIMRFRDALPYTEINYNDVAIYPISKTEVVDVNNENDFWLAEAILNKRKGD